MQRAHVEIKTPDGVCDSFVAFPNETGTFSPVILLMDVFGPRPWLFEMTEQMAALGYFVLCPNLFYRSRKAPLIDQSFPLDQVQFGEAIQYLMPMMKAWSPELAMKDLLAFTQYFDQQKQIRKGKLGISGYCFGGSLGLRMAARFPERVTCLASFHAGNLATDAADSPHLLLRKVKAELYFGHADNDKSLPPDQIERFQQALEETPLRYETEVYKGAAHGFTMRDLPAYNEQALKKHWKKVAELFTRTL
jgi:carboxymethylenebutenolidase